MVFGPGFKQFMWGDFEKENHACDFPKIQFYGHNELLLSTVLCLLIPIKITINFNSYNMFRIVLILDYY